MKTDSLIIISLIFSLFVMASAPAKAQQSIPQGYELVDSVIYRPTAAVDSSLVGRNVFKSMPSKTRGSSAYVNVYQSAEVPFLPS